jgi:hypothetical protein
MEQMKTSIDWLFEEIKPCICRDEVCDLLYELRSELEAKHKEEIKQAWLDGYSCGMYQEESSTEYYNEIFKEDGTEQN